MVRISWLVSAKADLKDIYNYISSDSKNYAQLQVEKIIATTKILKKNYTIGKIVAEINNPEIREIIVGNYRIIYRIVSNNEIHILMIHHGARDLIRRIK